MAITTGMSYTVETVVTETNTARAVGSGQVDVFSTPMMIAQMELAASRCIESALEAGQVSVGGHLNVSHSAATPIGMSVKTTATVTDVDGIKVTFTVRAEDEKGPIGEGNHLRFIVDEQRFTDKANKKLLV